MQSTKPAGVSHSFDAGHKWQNLDRQAENFFKGGFTKGRSFSKIGRVVESKNIKFVQRVEESSGGQGAIPHSCKELFGAAVSSDFDGLYEGIRQENRSIDVEQLSASRALSCRFLSRCF